MAYQPLKMGTCSTGVPISSCWKPMGSPKHRTGTAHLGILPNGALRAKEVEAQPAILQVVFLKYMVQIGSK